MNRKKTDSTWKLLQFVRNSIVFFCAVICLLTFSVVADEAPNTEKKDDEVVQQTEKKPAVPAKSTENKDAKKGTDTPSPDSDGAITEPTKEVIVGDSDEMDRDMKAGITILIGNVKTIRLNEQGIEIGFLNADKVTLKSDTKTGKTTEIIAVGNVEIRDQDIFATCDHATMNNLTNIITLKDNVVVLQNKDRLETKLFTFNRTTGKQKGVGNVKFKVTVTQATPEEAAETSSDSENTSATPSQTDKNDVSPEAKKEDEKKSDSDKSDAEEKTKPSETKKEEKDTESESGKDKETEPTESEETDETEGSEETE